MNSSLPQIIRRVFSDFDELTDTAQGWNLELCKLDATPFRGDVFQLVTDDFILSRGRFNARLKQSGEPPPGFRTCAVPAHASLNMLWRAQPVTGNDLLVFPSGGELHAFSEPGFDVFTLSFAEKTWAPLVEGGRLNGREVLPCNPVSMTRLRRLLHQIVRNPNPTETPTPAILSQLMPIIAEARPGSVAPRPHSRRIQAILQADRFIIAHPAEAATVQTLCAATGVSKRTLEYAFDRHLGIGPKTFINAVRLNGVRRQLRSGQPGQLRVADAANAWGFWHMGQFAADYRQLFGEKPSATLGCDAKTCRSTCPYRASCSLCEA